MKNKIWVYIIIGSLLPIIIWICIDRWEWTLFESTETLNNGWLSFWGAYLGGIATLIAVFVTIKKNFNLNKIQKIQRILHDNINVTQNLNFTNGTFNNEGDKIYTNYQPIREQRNKLLEVETATEIFLENYLKGVVPTSLIVKYLTVWQTNDKLVHEILDKSDDFFKFFQMVYWNQKEVSNLEQKIEILKSQLSDLRDTRLMFIDGVHKNGAMIDSVKRKIEQKEESLKNVNKIDELTSKTHETSSEINKLIETLESNRHDLKEITKSIITSLKSKKY